MILELTGASWSGENRRYVLFKSQAVAEQQLRAERPIGAADSAGDIGALLGLRAEHGHCYCPWKAHLCVRGGCNLKYLFCISSGVVLF